MKRNIFFLCFGKKMKQGELKLFKSLKINAKMRLFAVDFEDYFSLKRFFLNLTKEVFVIMRIARVNA